MDQNLRYQQNLKGRNLRIVVVRASSNRLVSLTAAGPFVLDALMTTAPGEIRIVISQS